MKDDETLLEKTMKELYKKGFRPLSPVGDIDNDPVLNMYLPLVGNVQFSPADLTSESTAKWVYQKGIDFLKSHNSGSQPFVAQRELFPSRELEVMYLNIFKQKQGDNSVHKYFQQDFGGQIGFVFNSGTKHSGKPDAIVPLSDELKVKQMKANFYGMARRGNTW
ncbi:hypothetical protein [Capnocytophaga catalasegens]|nr:hypothetical protein [Capnocytophaga catalasegens]